MELEKRIQEFEEEQVKQIIKDFNSAYAKYISLAETISRELIQVPDKCVKGFNSTPFFDPAKKSPLQRSGHTIRLDISNRCYLYYRLLENSKPDKQNNLRIAPKWLWELLKRHYRIEISCIRQKKFLFWKRLSITFVYYDDTDPFTQESFKESMLNEMRKDPMMKEYLKKTIDFEKLNES